MGSIRAEFKMKKADGQVQNVSVSKGIPFRALGAFCAVLLLAIPISATVIKAGMTLSIVVKNDKDLSAIVKVNDNGSIDYPLYQDMSVIDKTTSELQDILTYKLAKVVESPMVLVSVMTENPINLYVLGQVKKPGLLTLPPKSSLQEVMLAAGGTLETADLQRVKIVHKNQGDENASYYDLAKFLSSGDLTLLPNLYDGDRIILLASKKSKYVKILGAVNKPGFYPVGEQAGLFDMLYLAGGPNADANMSKVRIISSAGGQKADYLLDMQRYIDNGKTDELPLMGEGDLVIVYAKVITWQKTLDVMRDIVTFLTAWFVITSVIKK
jgi:protein involved in polysaccharide export with SLBB domain